MPDILIRQAKPNELPRIIYITKLAYKIPYKDGALTTKAHEPKNIKEVFAKKEFFALVAEYNNKIIGAVRYKFVEKNNIYLHRLAVLKTFRNKSVGSSLVREVEKTAKKKKAKKILLDCVREKKLPDYYEKLGYKTDEIKKHHDHHDVYMSKKI